MRRGGKKKSAGGGPQLTEAPELFTGGGTTPALQRQHSSGARGAGHWPQVESLALHLSGGGGGSGSTPAPCAHPAAQRVWSQVGKCDDEDGDRGLLQAARHLRSRGGGSGPGSAGAAAAESPQLFAESSTGVMQARDAVSGWVGQCVRACVRG